MNKLIAISQEKEEKVLQKMRKLFPQMEIEKFIYMFNQKFFSTENKHIEELVNLIAESYSNIELNGKYLSIYSEAETVIYSLIPLIEQWGFVVSLKSLAEQMLEEGCDIEERIYFKEKGAGYAYIVNPKDDTKLIRHWSNKVLSKTYEKVIKDNPAIASIQEEYGEDTIGFSLKNISGIDETFILELKDFIINKANNN